MIKKLLIANRGEIACRIIKTAKKMSIKTIAVFSEADKNSLHVSLADQAICIGPAPSQQSYLNQTKIIAVAKEHKADAIHPGYGFLAENSEFALLCEKQGITFVGPSSACIKSMGDKSLAKELMQNANVPTVPGYQGEDQSEKTLLAKANAIGYPVLIKAASGGGGKGMRVVNAEGDFYAALREAKQESLSSFNDDRVLLEKYLPTARHIEVQIFADQHQQVVYLFDRECSIQRRHQKIIEEAIAPRLSDELRQKMGDAAVRAAQAIHYSGAGTIEFLLDAQDQFYFMEMNTRLQVEHPVTEMITRQDLVEWQLRVASGEPLPLTQNELKTYGHAIEARICAENPRKNFIPATGKLELLHFPTAREDVRIDSGVLQGDRISHYYDSLIAKLIVFAETREAAINKLRDQLAETYVIGIDTNIEFLSAICKNADFYNAQFNTQFVALHQNALLKEKENLPPIVIAAMLAAEFRWRQEQGQELRKKSQDSNSPWFDRGGWRLSAKAHQQLRVWYHGKPLCYTFCALNDIISIAPKICANIKWLDDLRLTITIDEELFHVAAVHQDRAIFVFYNGSNYALQLNNPNKTNNMNTEIKIHFSAPMPSTVVEIFVSDGQKVVAGEKLLVLEAMKMRHTISAPEAGTVKQVYFKVGDLLSEGETLLEFDGSV